MFRVYRVLQGCIGNKTPVMENQLEEKVKHEMETVMK